MSIKYSVHEWLADRARFIQYPKPQRATRKAEWICYKSSPIIQAEKNTGEARLSWTGKLVLLFYSFFALCIGLVGMAVAGIGIWAIISSFFD